MTDTDKLNDAILESGIKIVAIAGKLGISRKGFYKKLNNETEFKDSEIAAMQKILGLTNRKRDEIFLLKWLNKNQPADRSENLTVAESDGPVASNIGSVISEKGLKNIAVWH